MQTSLKASKGKNKREKKVKKKRLLGMLLCKAQRKNVIERAKW